MLFNPEPICSFGEVQDGHQVNIMLRSLPSKVRTSIAKIGVKIGRNLLELLLIDGRTDISKHKLSSFRILSTFVKGQNVGCPRGIGSYR